MKMTRINSAIEPVVLCDQHLLAEYKEMLRLIAHSYKAKGNRPTKFTLGKGHVLFFLDKGEFLKKRHGLICNELKRRGFNLTYEYSYHADGMNSDYETTQEEYNALYERVVLRMPKAPKYAKEPISTSECINLLGILGRYTSTKN